MTRRSLLSAALLAPPPPESFTAGLWKAIQPIYAKTLRHPFLTGLQDGTLAESKFQFYLVQDSLYLGAFGKALRLLAEKAPHPDWAKALRGDAEEAIAVEKQMHSQILASFGVPAAKAQAARMAPTNYAYTNHLLIRCVEGGFLEGLSAVLPCYWIYWEVGKHLVQSGSRNPAYQRWIAQYAGEEYGKTVRRALSMTDAAAASASPQIRTKSHELFVLSARYEFLFWDMAFREEKWLP